MESTLKNTENTENTAEETAENLVEETKKTFGVPFKAGEEWNGNKLGRPKGSRNLTTLFKETFEEIKERAKAQGQEISDPEMDIIISLLTTAKKGNVRAMELYMKYKYGNPTQPIDLSGDVKVKTEGITDAVEFFKTLITKENIEYTEKIDGIEIDKVEE